MDKNNHIKEVLDQLQLTEGVKFEFDEEAIDKEYQKRNKEQSNLTTKVLSIVGGFLTTLAFLGFLGILGVFESELALLILGIGFIVGAIWLNNKFDKLIIDTLSISIFVAGFSLLAIGLEELNADEKMISLIFLIIAIASIIIMQNYILSFISVLIINGCLLVLLISTNEYLIHLYISLNTILLTYVVLNEAKVITTGGKLSRLYDPIRIGLIISLIAGLIFVGIKDFHITSFKYIWLSSVATISAILYLISIILNIIGIKALMNKIIIYVLSVSILLLTAFSPAVSGTILIILLCYLVNYRTGLTIGIISFIYFISQYYYDLNFTLLVKSEILFSSGILFLLIYLFTSKKLKANEKV